MYTLYITLCITAGGNAFPQLQRKTSHLVLRAVFAAYISLGPNALLFLQLLIAIVTMSAVNISGIPTSFLLVSLVTNRVSFEEECLPSFEVLNLPCVLLCRQFL